MTIQSETINRVTGGKDVPSDRWTRLEIFVERLERPFGGNITPEDLATLGTLYQATIADLGRARASGDAVLAARLNILVGRAYSQIYRRPGLRFMDMVMFFVRDFPRLFRARIHFILAAAAMFTVAVIIGYLCLRHDSKLLDLVIPPSMRQSVTSSLQSGKVKADFPAEARFEIANRIFFHNVEVSFLAFAGGLPAGIGTVYLMIVNGMLLGGLGALYAGHSRLSPFLSIILPHGGLELLCIFICAGAGLILAWALIRPGPFKRSDWLAREGLDAVKLVVGTIPLFLFAALIETWISPSELAGVWKFLTFFIALELAFLYLAFAGLETNPLRAWFGETVSGPTSSLRPIAGKSSVRPPTGNRP